MRTLLLYIKPIIQKIYKNVKIMPFFSLKFCESASLIKCFLLICTEFINVILKEVMSIYIIYILKIYVLISIMVNIERYNPYKQKLFGVLNDF